MPYDITIPGWMTEDELKSIETISKHVPENGSVLEIGSFYGRSSYAWSKSIPQSAKLICVDYWTGWVVDFVGVSCMHGTIPKGPIKIELKRFLEYTKDCKNITPIVGDSRKVMPTLTDKFDVIFLDGEHKNPILSEDIELSLPLLKHDGILCGHDYSNSWPDVISEVDKLSKRLGKNIRFYENSTIWSI